MRERAREKDPFVRSLLPGLPAARVQSRLHGDAGSGWERRARWHLRRATPTLPALAPLQRRRAISCGALLALKVGLEYFNRAIKRMLTYICQEIHF